MFQGDVTIEKLMETGRYAHPLYTFVHKGIYESSYFLECRVASCSRHEWTVPEFTGFLSWEVLLRLYRESWMERRLLSRYRGSLSPGITNQAVQKSIKNLSVRKNSWEIVPDQHQWVVGSYRPAQEVTLWNSQKAKR